MSVVKAPQTKLANPLAGFISIQVVMLKRLRTAAVDIYVQYEAAGLPVLYRRAGYSLESQKLFGLAEAGVEQVYVRLEDFQGFGTHLLESVEAANDQEQVPYGERFAALQMALAVEIERTARLLDCGPYASLSEETGRKLTSLLAANDVLPRDLYRLARHDFNTFTHVTNVASYMVVLAERMGITDHSELEQVAVGAMLHDVGKRFIPSTILNKPARLDPIERAIIETHPQRGYEDLYDREELNLGQKMMVYQHHERVDGNGYPVGILAKDIHLWAKMLAVVDVFDAMTGSRPYRRPATSREAMDYIMQNAGTHFDQEAVRCWNSAMNPA